MAKRGIEYLQSGLKPNLDRTIATPLAVVLGTAAVVAMPWAMYDTRSWNPLYTQVRDGRKIRKIITIADPDGTNALTTYGTDDPRASRYGKALRRSGIDEAPQLLDVVRGRRLLYGPFRAMLDTDKERLQAADSVRFHDLQQATAEAYGSGIPDSLASPSSVWRKSIRYDASDPDVQKAVDRMSMDLDLNWFDTVTFRRDLAAMRAVPGQIIAGILNGYAWQLDESATQSSSEPYTSGLGMESTSVAIA